MLFQLALGALLFNSQNWTFDDRFPNGVMFYAFDSFFGYIMEWTNAGASFVFNANGLPPEDTTDPGFLLKTFAFGVLPTVVFFASLMSVLYYSGIMEPIIRGKITPSANTIIVGPPSVAA